MIACVGGGSNAIGTFYEFIGDENTRLIGVEAGGDGLGEGQLNSATLTKGTPGVLHGARTYLLQTETGQVSKGVARGATWTSAEARQQSHT